MTFDNLPALWQQLDGPQVGSLLKGLKEWIKEQWFGHERYWENLSIDTANSAHLTLIGIIMGVPRPFVLSSYYDEDLFRYTRTFQEEYAIGIGDGPPPIGLGGWLDYVTPPAGGRVYRPLSTELYRTVLKAAAHSKGIIGSLTWIDDICHAVMGDDPYTWSEYPSQAADYYPQDKLITLGVYDLNRWTAIAGLCDVFYTVLPRIHVTMLDAGEDEEEDIGTQYVFINPSGIQLPKYCLSATSSQGMWSYLPDGGYVLDAAQNAVISIASTGEEVNWTEVLEGTRVTATFDPSPWEGSELVELGGWYVRWYGAEIEGEEGGNEVYLPIPFDHPEDPMDPRATFALPRIYRTPDDPIPEVGFYFWWKYKEAVTPFVPLWNINELGLDGSDFYGAYTRWQQAELDRGQPAPPPSWEYLHMQPDPANPTRPKVGDVVTFTLPLIYMSGYWGSFGLDHLGLRWYARYSYDPIDVQIDASAFAWDDARQAYAVQLTVAESWFEEYTPPEPTTDAEGIWRPPNYEDYDLGFINLIAYWYGSTGGSIPEV